MKFASRVAALHGALWSDDRAYRLSWYVGPASLALLICGWISIPGPDESASSSAPWGKPAPNAKVRSAGGPPDLSIWPEKLRDDVRSCTVGNEDWGVRVEACSRLIESRLLSNWQMVAIYNQRGMHYAKTQPTRALADYDAALKIRPNTPQVLMNRVNIHFARGQWDAAIADSSKAIEMLTPELAARARVIRAQAYYTAGDYDKAKIDLDESEKIDQENPELYLLRGNIDYDEKRFAAAALDFEQFSKRRPHNPAGFIGRGMALEADSRFQEALLDYEAAIRLDPTDSRATSGRDRLKNRQPCGSLCWNQPTRLPGWQDTVAVP